LGEYYFNTGDSGYVKISSIGTHGTVIADAVKFVYKDSLANSFNTSLDLNCDNKINVQDFAIILSFWGKQSDLDSYQNNACAISKNIDFDFDTEVGEGDIGILLSSWFE